MCVWNETMCDDDCESKSRVARGLRNVDLIYGIAERLMQSGGRVNIAVWFGDRSMRAGFIVYVMCVLGGLDKGMRSY